MEPAAMSPALSTADNLLLRAWRRGELDPDACHAFETRLFFEPALLEAAQLDQALEAGLRDTAPTAPMFGNADPRLRRPPPPWAMLLAAGLGAAAVLPFALRPDPAAEWQGNVEWVSVDARRGTADAEPLLIAPRASTGLVARELPAPAAARGPLTVRLLLADDSAPVYELGGLHAVDGIVSLAFPREALGAGVYRVEFRDGGDGSALAGPALSFRYRPR
jgi:hypothetical protein